MKKTKRFTILIAALFAFVLPTLSGFGTCVKAESSGSGSDSLGGFSVFSCTQQDFSFKYDKTLSTEWDEEGGAYVYVKKHGYIPYVLVWAQKGNSPATPEKIEGYFQDFTQEMIQDYGDDLTDIGAYQEYTFGGVKANGIKYTYYVGNAKVESLRLLLAYGNSIAVLTAKSMHGETDATYAALSQIMETFRPEAFFYDNQASGASAFEPQAELPHSLGAYSVERNEPLTLQTTLFDGGFFSFECPVGWRIETVGAYTTFGFKAYDPQVPERMIYFYGKQEFFNKSAAAKERYQQLANMTWGDPYGYGLSAAVPSLDPPTTEKYYSVYSDFMDVVYQLDASYQYPVINDLYVMETFANNTFTTPGCMDNSIVRATFRSGNNVLCEGLLAGQVTNLLTYMDGGVDLGMYCVYDVMGVAAPAAEFPELQDTLTRCLSTFTFTQEYLRAAAQNAQQQTDIILANGRKMQAAYDSYNAAWSERQTGYDITSQKYSDATLGYDRLYDPDTGEVYRAELGFYDQYDTNRGEFANPRLQIIDDSTSQYYLEGVDYYIHK